MEFLPDDKNSEDDPAWSPDGKTMMMAQYPPQAFGGTPGEYAILNIDVSTRKISKLPGASGMWGPRWSPDGRYVSTFSADDSKLMLLDLKTGQWSELAVGRVLAYPNWSLDGKYISYQDTGNDGPELDRVSVPAGRKERVAGLKDISRSVLSLSNGAWNGVAPNNSLLIMRDVGNREIYALEMQLP